MAMTTWPETFQNLLIKFIDFLPALITALVVFFASLYLAGVSSNVVSRALKRREADPEIVSLGSNITRASKRRVEVSAGVAYESDPDMVRKVALEAMASIPGLLVDPAPFVRFQSFGGSTFDLA